MKPAEINYWCGRVLDARSKQDWQNAVIALGREIGVEDEPNFDWVDFEPGTFKVIGKYVGPLELLGIPIRTDSSMEPGKIKFSDTFDFDFEADSSHD